ncbi:polygalacturonase non-catalytic subunit AroGP3-like [Macadamia integrifolia]|uniref:polygalacturonase non-catalytic subunit AroGP3-like n=1 Tax=Macadamia integrifolia TaxID=60698 RepID=UPI001C4E7198|nr:polygalacturonase non-catalytic subunit AroGP3-like [Macadamia integrifolia]
MTRPIFLLGLLIVAYFSGFHAENAFSKYWEEHIINLSDPPHWLVAKASPLNLHQAAFYMKLMEENELASHLRSFCKLANIVCSTNVLLKKTMDDTTLPPIAQWNAIKVVYEDTPKEIPMSVTNQGGLPFFRESMVKEGDFMAVPDLRDPMSYRSFFPQPLASKVPFSLAQIEGLKKMFGVVDESNMDQFIQDTLKICEERPIRDDRSTCATSGEDLIDFIIKQLGHNVCIWSTESIEGSYENVTIGAVELIYGNMSEPPALCHSLPFPFQVYYCHVLQKVKVFVVDIHVQKKVNHAIMVCHYDTSTWNPNHIAFKLLGFGPGLIEICHWINENGLVWTKSLA